MKTPERKELLFRTFPAFLEAMARYGERVRDCYCTPHHWVIILKAR